MLRYTEPDQARNWKRMTLYRTTDAADTLNMAALLIAAYCQRIETPMDTLASYLQVRQQQDRAAGPRKSDHDELAGLLGDPPPADDADGLRYAWGKRHAENALIREDYPQKLLTEACLHGLRARLCGDVDSLDGYLPPHIAQIACKVADALEEPLPAAA